MTYEESIICADMQQESGANHSNNTSCTGLLQRLAHSVPPLLLRNHHREPLEIVELAALFDSRELLRPARLFPLLHNLVRFNALLHGTGARCAGEFRYSQRGESEMAVGVGLAGYRGGRAVNDCLHVKNLG